MKLKSDKLSMPTALASKLSENPTDTQLTGDDVQTNEASLRGFINESRNHLMILRSELYAILDTGFRNAQNFNIENNTDKDTKIFDDPLSQFLQKAYTVQEWDENNEPIENRNQAYINAGVSFNKYEGYLTDDQLFLREAADMLNAINTGLSQLNRTENYLKKAKAGDNQEEYYNSAANALAIMPKMLDLIKDKAAKSKVIEIAPNPKGWKKILSGLKDFCSKCGDFFRNLGKSDEDIKKAKFSVLKNRVTEMKKASKSKDEVLDSSSSSYRRPGP